MQTNVFRTTVYGVFCETSPVAKSDSSSVHPQVSHSLHGTGDVNVHIKWRKSSCRSECSVRTHSNANLGVISALRALGYGSVTKRS